MTPEMNALRRLFPFEIKRLARDGAVDRAIARAELVRRLHAARRTVRALRDELLNAEMKVGFAALEIEQLDQQEQGRALA